MPSSTRDGRRAFVNTTPRPARDVRHEAAGLAWLASSRSRCQVLAVGDDFLVLELIESGAARRSFDGARPRSRGCTTAPPRSLATQNFIGRLPQDNRSGPGWATFYRGAWRRW
jgi:fructosamine-3-kinase